MLCEYTRKYLLNQPFDTWLPIKTLPRMIGYAGIITAATEKLLEPEFIIEIGKLGATYRIVSVEKERLRRAI